MAGRDRPEADAVFRRGLELDPFGADIWAAILQRAVETGDGATQQLALARLLRYSGPTRFIRRVAEAAPPPH